MKALLKQKWYWNDQKVQRKQIKLQFYLNKLVSSQYYSTRIFQSQFKICKKETLHRSTVRYYLTPPGNTLNKESPNSAAVVDGGGDGSVPLLASGVPNLSLHLLATCVWNYGGFGEEAELVGDVVGRLDLMTNFVVLLYLRQTVVFCPKVKRRLSDSRPPVVRRGFE